jgi:hypothetical protein
VYDKATKYVAAAGLLQEVEWQRQTAINSFDESDFLRECAWVILCSGFREAAIRRAFGYISLCFCDWESARAIVESAPTCGLAARAAFNNVRKIDAITEIAHIVCARGFAPIKAAVQKNPIEELIQLPHIGPITVWHLAKNLGLDVVKPDRHLIRISIDLGFPGPLELCSAISKQTGDPLKVIDLIIWRYMADREYDRNHSPSGARNLHRLSA